MNKIYTYLFLLLALLSINIGQISAQIRPIDGIGTNPLHDDWGSINNAMIDMTDISFSNGYSEPTGQNRANPRKISNLIFCQIGSIPNNKNLSDYTFMWGQFIDHDITLVMDSEHERVNISVPRFDAWMDPWGGGNAIIPVPRSLVIEGTGDSFENPRRYANAITAYMDGSNVYGSTKERASWLRQFVDGKLKFSDGNLLPYNTITGEYDSEIDPNAPMMAHPITPPDGKWFVAGDIRANENVLLTSIHTTFLREHNRQCDLIKAANPDWDDEKIYQKARKIVGGIIQSISYNEWLPIMTGKDFPSYNGFNPDVNVQVSNAFAAAAFRYGHTTINSKIIRMDENGHPMPGGDMIMANAFFQPHAIRESNGVECFLKGMCYQSQQEVDCKVIDDLRNMLFGPPGAGGMDLAAINIQRGRERGLADYNTMRVNYGLEPVTDFSQISDNAELIQNLYDIYNGEINEIDPWVGMLAENHNENSMFGELLEKIIVEQFSRTRVGDPFYYLIDPELTEEEKNEITNTKLGDVISRTTLMNAIPTSIFITEPNANEPRSITGVNNNIENPEWGCIDERMIRRGTNGYSDLISAPAGSNRPNSRALSNAVFAQDKDIYDNLELSDYVFNWGQFVDHDCTLVSDSKEPCFIQVPKGDPWFDPNSTGEQVIPEFRSIYDILSGTSPENPRQHKNEVTAFIDGSNVYGSTQERANWLRTHVDGKLKVSEGNLLPYNTVSGEYSGSIDYEAPGMAHPITPPDGRWFVAGDVRANENPLLTAIHTLWVREHNRICNDLVQTYPGWSDEAIYQEARRIVIGEIENITFNEWLPAIGIHLDKYEGYNPKMHPQIMNLFSAASFRFGHSIINGQIQRLNSDCSVHESGHARLRDCFFDPASIREKTNNRLEPYFIGMMHQRQQGLDTKIIDDVRNFLFGKPGEGGLDLAAMNIERGRERGLADYNTTRKDFGLQPKISFATLTSNIGLNQKLFESYEDIYDVDLFVGLLAEDHLSGSLFGDLGSLVMKEQFAALRDGDRFFFEIDEGLSEEQKREIRYTTLATVMAKNTDIENVPNNLFYYQGICTDVVDLDFTSLDVNLYPNPGYYDINLEINIDNRLDGYVKISTILGQTLQSEKVELFEGNNRLKFNINDIPSGIYLLNFTSEKGNFSKRFVKQ